MNRGFSAELRRLLVFTGLCACFGLLNGYLTWTLIGGGAVYMGWMMWQIYRLDLWLNNSRSQAPDASGIWGDIFDNVEEPSVKGTPSGEPQYYPYDKVFQSGRTTLGGDIRSVMTNRKG